jgi:hypothetical protein
MTKNALKNVSHCHKIESFSMHFQCNKFHNRQHVKEQEESKNENETNFKLMIGGQ